MSNNRVCDHNEYLENDDDVIAFGADSMRKISKFKNIIRLFLEGELSNKLVEYLEKSGIQCAKIYDYKNRSTNNYKWLTNGKDCEILKVGSNGWKKGKIRLKITLEFIPDEPEINEPESPLDDIRQSMNQS
ncbi:KGK domain-containing protein [Crocosphaera sp. XPORK-15E]|uniref:KGK domain-containing protein n=1 Tax=Crocosphaera sp. XPORK-15E TaxID=3110247 RepID=UPI002B1FADC0|nr:KGK domain-containing protein [Crocosphaera sp. XPORK-15E]MEA5537289.1 KGK domain-containing protein [Crocosphaera sp. XPORK-15E]